LFHVSIRRHFLSPILHRNHSRTQLGSGAFGTVYRCRHRLDGCEYAVKRLARKLIGDARRRECLREVSALSALQHASASAPASLVRYFGAWIDDGLLHIQVRNSRLGSEWRQSVYRENTKS
jgi:wee1-like protein kinase